MPELLNAPETALPGALLPRIFRVRSTKRELEDTWTLVLEPADGEPPFEFEPGQFTMLYVFGVGEIPISISGDPARPEHLMHTVRIVGPASRAVATLKRGAPVGVRGPFGTAWPLVQAEGHDVAIVAGGIGLAPLRPAILHLLSARARYGRVSILIGARTPDNLLYEQEVERWRARFDVELRVTVDRATRDWRGNVGVVTTLIPRGIYDAGHTVAMVCGPEVMMRFTATELAGRGVPLDQIFLSMERNMKCAVGLCGHCQFGPHFVCRDGPVFPCSVLDPLLRIREV